MTSDSEAVSSDPPQKRRRLQGSSSPKDAGRVPREGNEDGEGDARRSQHREDGFAEGGRSMRRNGADDDGDGCNYASAKRYHSRSPDLSRSASPARPSRSRSISSASSRSRSPSPSQSRSPTRSPSSQRRSRSRFTSDRSRTESYSPGARPPEPVKPNYRAKFILRGHAKAVSQVRLSPDGRFIASASADATLKIWDASTGHHIDTLVGHMAGVNCVAWGPDSNTLATGSDDKAIRLWDRVSGRPKTKTRKSMAVQDMPPLCGHHNYVYCLAFSPKGNILASGSYDEAVFLWDVRAGRLMRSLPAHSDPVSGIDFCCDGTLVVSCSTDGLIRVWDTSTGQCLRTLVHEDNPAVTNVCFSPNGRFVLAFNLDNCIRLWDYVGNRVKKTYQGHRNQKFSVGGCFAVLGGQPFIAAASEDGTVVVWDVQTKEILQRVDGHEGVCFWVDVNGETMVSGGQDHTVRVYCHAGQETKINGAAMEDGAGKGRLQSELPIRHDEIKREDA